MCQIIFEGKRRMKSEGERERGGWERGGMWRKQKRRETSVKRNEVGEKEKWANNIWAQTHPPPTRSPPCCLFQSPGCHVIGSVCLTTCSAPQWARPRASCWCSPWQSSQTGSGTGWSPGLRGPATPYSGSGGWACVCRAVPPVKAERKRRRKVRIIRQRF